MLLLLMIWEEHKFNIRKTIKIVFLNKFNFYFTVIVIIVFMIQLLFYQASLFDNIYLLLITYFYSHIFLVIFEINDYLKLEYIIDFSIQQFKEIETDEREKLISKYQLFYYSILLYSKRVENELKEKFKNNITQLMGLKYLLILASEVFYNEDESRKRVLNILKRLKKTDPLIDNKEFMNIIKDIRINFNKKYLETFDKDPEENIFHYESRLNKFKTFLLLLFPILSVILSIIDFFL
mgnify:CR=1 FL=1